MMLWSAERGIDWKGYVALLRQGQVDSNDLSPRIRLSLAIVLAPWHSEGGKTGLLCSLPNRGLKQPLIGLGKAFRKVPVFVRTQDQAAPLAVNIAKYQETGRPLYIGLVSHIERPSV